MKKNNIKKNKKLLILGATVNQLPFVKIAKEKSFFTITLDNVPKNICHKYSDKNINISTIDKDLVLNYANEQKIDGVVTCASDLALPTVAYVCNKLNLPSVSNDAVLKTINKGLFRKFLLENDFNLPKYFVFSKENDALVNILKLKNKWIVKPVDSSGSKGIYLIDLNIKDINLNQIINNAFSFSKTKKIIVEEYINGDNCSVDGFINNGLIDILCITNKILTPLPHLTPVGHTLPSKLSKEVQKKIESIIEKILKILKVKTSPFDFDIIVTKNGDIYVLEMSLRIGGNGIPKLIFYSNGYNLYESVILYALNEKIPKIVVKDQLMYTGVFLICSSKTGVIKNISIKEIILKKYFKYIKELVYDVRIGDKVEKFTQGNHRLGHYILQTKNEKLLEKISKEVNSDLNLIVD